MPAPMAFRLTSDGDLDVAFCSFTTVDEVEVDFTPTHWPWERPDPSHFSSQSLLPLKVDHGESLSINNADGFVKEGKWPSQGVWSRVDIWFYLNDQVTAVGTIDRSALVVNEWVWNAKEIGGAVSHCAPIDGVPAPR